MVSVVTEINPIYLREETQQKIRSSFLNSEFPALILKDFFSTKFYTELEQKISSLKFKKEVAVVHHCYAVSSFTLSSKYFSAFLSLVTKKKMNDLCFTAYCLTWKDYLILHDRYLEKPGLDIIIDLTERWNSDWGGKVIFTDGEGTVYPLEPARNSIALVERKKGLNKYIQYLNHQAKDRKRILLIASI